MRPSMDDDAIDFKPFFDMVVGLLFMLLILISAQLFFSQWSPQTDAPKNPREQYESDIDAVLSDMARKLTGAGFTPVVDRVARTVQIPAPQVLGANGNRRATAAPLARALADVLGCVSLVNAGGDCAPPRQAQLEALRMRLALPGPAGAPTPAARSAGLDLAAAVFGTAPELFTLALPGKRPLMPTEVTVESGAANPGVLVLDARFNEPPVSALPPR